LSKGWARGHASPIYGPVYHMVRGNRRTDTKSISDEAVFVLQDIR
jgi:hypothetical protein